MPKDFLATVDKYKPFVKVIPMSKWHLYSEFKNGEPVGGRITFVWLFGMVGVFVLVACLYQLHEPKHSTIGKEKQRSGRT